MQRILIVESREALANSYRSHLATTGYRVYTAHNPHEAQQLVTQKKPDLVIFNTRLSGNNGLGLIQQLQAMGFSGHYIALLALEDRQTRSQAQALGIEQFLVTPFTRETLIFTIESLLEKIPAPLPLADLPLAQSGFIGECPEMKAIYQTILAAAKSKASIFITGESGTGKEVCAQAIHQESDRRKQNFIALNCAAIPRELIESEIFGHVKGAFTGAVNDREGAATKADGGTLFLDEIGEMDLELQSKLLRFIQTGSFQRVGSSRQENVDVRFVCATNRDPIDSVNNHRLREDLYYRLNVIPIHLPPLRTRGDDVLTLAGYFLQKFAKEEGKSFRAFSPSAEQLLKTYHWPGNIRQLQNVIRNIVVLHDGQLVNPDLFPAPLNGGDLVSGSLLAQSTPSNYHSNSLTQDFWSKLRQLLIDQGIEQNQNSDVIELWRLEMTAIIQAIQTCNNSVPEAARRLGVSPSTIYRKRQEWESSGILEKTLSTNSNH